MGKKWYTSKTIWVNIIAAISSLVASQFGYTITVELQAGILMGINIILRIITKESIVGSNWETNAR